MRSFFRAMLDCRSAIYEKRDRAAADAYATVEKFLLEDRYSTYRHANELAKMKLAGYSDHVIASQLGINESTLRNHTRNVSNELYKLFGVSFFDMLSNYKQNKNNVAVILQRVRNQKKMAISYVLPEVVQAIRGSLISTGTYDLADCNEEMDFLSRFSYAFMTEALSTLDPGKLLYLIGVLDGRFGTPEEWVAVVSRITGEVNK